MLKGRLRHISQTAACPLPPSLRLLSFNMQVGIHTQAYHHYLTRAWQHFLPSQARQQRLQLIAQQLKAFDIIGLQEVDGGSLRTLFVNQVTHLAEKADFFWHYQQTNRNLGRWAQHSNGVLARWQPWQVQDHQLPGLPGRGALITFFGNPKEPLVIVNAHLALSPSAQFKQLDYLCRVIAPYSHLVFMGDFNASYAQLTRHPGLQALGLVSMQDPEISTYPSWRPQRHLDHILHTPSLKTQSLQVGHPLFSDHCPISTQLQIPAICRAWG